jgi:hypothetical protein
MVWCAAACPSSQNCPNRSAGAVLKAREEAGLDELSEGGHDGGLELGISEQVRQKFLHALHGVKQLVHAGSFPGNLLRGEVGDDGIA